MEPGNPGLSDTIDVAMKGRKSQINNEKKAQVVGLAVQGKGRRAISKALDISEHEARLILEQEEVTDLLSLTREEQKNRLIDLGMANLQKLSRRMDEIIDQLPLQSVPIAYGIQVERLLDLLHGRKGAPITQQAVQNVIQITPAEAESLRQTIEAEGEVVEEER
jgi:transposase